MKVQIESVDTAFNQIRDMIYWKESKNEIIEVIIMHHALWYELTKNMQIYTTFSLPPVNEFMGKRIVKSYDVSEMECFIA
jgi:hypothetical protein